MHAPPGYPTGPQYPQPAWGYQAPAPAPKSSTARTLGEILFWLGVVGLICTALVAGVTALGAATWNSKTATITEISNEWCTYEWQGNPAPSGETSDTCPAGATVGAQVPILVTADGSAWTSRSSYWQTMGALIGFGITASMAVLIAGWALRRPR